MTILPKFFRAPLRKAPKSNRTRALGCESLEGRRMLAYTINVGTHVLLPNTADQVIEISVVNNGPSQPVSGMILDAELGDGASPATQPGFSNVDFETDTVWVDEAVFAPDPPPPLVADPEILLGAGGRPAYITNGVLLGNGPGVCANGNCDFEPNGLLVQITIDTTGVTSGSYDLLLSGGDGGDSVFVIDSETTLAPTIINGLVVINSAPVADAVVDPATNYTVGFGGSFQLDGSESSDADPGDSITSYQWDLNSGTFGSADITGQSPTVSWANLNAAGITTPGTYPITLQVTDSNGSTDTATVDLVVSPATVQGRHIFYNNSFYDSSAFFGFPDDDSAIDTTKSALRAGGTATFANYTGTAKGINGIMIDVDSTIDVASISNLANVASNFDFTVTTSNQVFVASPEFTDFPLAPAPTPTAITVRPGDGLNGSNRISIFWNDGAIQKQWLRVTLVANEATGLEANDVFYFGNEVGETGNSVGNTFVDGSDFGGTRDNPHDFINRAPIGDPYDFNKDSFVDGTDLGVPRDNANNFLTALKLISVPSSFAARTQALPSTVESEATSNMLVDSSEGEELSAPSAGKTLLSEAVDYCVAEQVESSVGASEADTSAPEDLGSAVLSDIDSYMSEYANLQGDLSQLSGDDDRDATEEVDPASGDLLQDTNLA